MTRIYVTKPSESALWQEVRIMETQDPRLQSLEKRTRKLERWLGLSVCGWLLTFGVMVVSAWTWQVKSQPQSDTLRLRRLAIVDENGTERVVLGAPVPEPIILGKRITRGGPASGIILFDAEGNERSGYVTTDGYPNVLFTLDSLARQHVLFMTEPQGSTALWLWDANDNSFQLNVNDKSPRLKITRQGKVVFEQPSTENKTDPEKK
jgi:hypothetical protein